MFIIIIIGQWIIIITQPQMGGWVPPKFRESLRFIIKNETNYFTEYDRYLKFFPCKQNF